MLNIQPEDPDTVVAPVRQHPGQEQNVAGTLEASSLMGVVEVILVTSSPALTEGQSPRPSFLWMEVLC